MLDERLVFKDLPDRMISEGRYSASGEEIATRTGRPIDAVRHGMARLRAQGRAFSPARGLYVFVPAEYRSWKVTPATWFIDDLMRHLDRPYYVGLLSAAGIHGASHQAPQVFQVVTDRPVAERNLERVRLRFYASKHLAETPTISQNSQTGTFRVSTREATVVDLVDRPDQAGGLGNVATIVGEIGELDGAELARLSSLRPLAHSRRLGWLLDRFRPDVDARRLRKVAKPSQGVASKLVSGLPASKGQLDADWGLLVNSAIEADT